ncbi:MAG TPA: carbon-nitrogen hydrolase family protein [Aggregatilineales bacterium]|nr:carbon-nitrogen hydrolase family protein [Aggregatilineales bacterium]
MSVIRVALLQMAACGNDQGANLAKGEEFCRLARAAGADIALFPEMWNNGYTFYDPNQPGAFEGWMAEAVGPQGLFVKHFQALAKELQMAIAITYLEEWDDGPRDTVSLFDWHGELVLTYAKVHTCEFDLEAACTPGDGFYVRTLATAQGPVKVGAMICYDREFPESARILMLQGAELILVPNACEMEENRTGQLRARAYENMLGVALANYADAPHYGHSVAFDGIAFTPEGVSRDTTLVRAGEGEGLHMATFDLAKMREYRGREIWGNAFRRPRHYGLLTSPQVEPPFVRPEARR